MQIVQVQFMLSSRRRPLCIPSACLERTLMRTLRLFTFYVPMMTKTCKSARLQHRSRDRLNHHRCFYERNDRLR